MRSNSKKNTIIRSILCSFLAVFIILTFLPGCPRTQKGGIGKWKQLNPNPSLWVSPSVDFEVLDVQVVDSNFIVAVGSNKMFLRTSNFGNTWLPFRTLPSEGIQTVHFINRDTGYAAGVPTTADLNTPVGEPSEPIKIWRTTNGGVTWENVLRSLTGPREVITDENYVCAPGDKSRINDLYFTDENNGIAVGEYDYGESRFYTGLVLWTNDGGQTWNWNIPPGGLLTAIDFANENLGIAVGGVLGFGGTMVDIHGVRTTQGIAGQPYTCEGEFTSYPLGWDDLESNIQTGLGGKTGILTGISFSNDTTAYVTGAVGIGSIDYYGIFGTMDAGESWDTMFTTEGTQMLNEILYDVSCPITTGGTVVGSNGLILRSYSSTPSDYWQPKSSNTNVSLTCVDFISPNRGVIGGQGNTILITKDGGDSWEGPRSVTVYDLYGIELFNNDLMAVCGDRGTIATSEDCGETWCLQCTGTTRTIFDIAYSSLTSGIAVGQHGYAVYTDDGQSWNTPESYPFNTGITSAKLDMNGIDFFTDSRAVAVGKNRLGITEDAGRNWTTRSIPMNAHLMDVACLDADHAVAVGNNGMILRTEDGGQIWNEVQTPFTDHLCGVYFLDPQYGWAVGYNVGAGENPDPALSEKGTILHTQDGGLTWTEQTSLTTIALMDVHFADQNTGIAVGGKGSSQDPSSVFWGIILVTFNGGTTWNITGLPKAENLRGVSILPDGRVYIAGSRGFIARTDSLSEL